MTAAGAFQACDDAKQRRFARAGMTDKSKHFAFAEAKGNVIDRSHPTVCMADVLKDKHRPADEWRSRLRSRPLGKNSMCFDGGGLVHPVAGSDPAASV